MAIKVWVIDRRAEKYKRIILRKARLVASFLSLNGYIEVFLVGNRQMKKNILSYVAEKPFPRPDIKEKYLGEIHLNPFHIKSKGEDLLFMLCHGLLHIAGYDHKKKNDRIRMEKKEAELFLKTRSTKH